MAKGNVACGFAHMVHKKGRIEVDHNLIGFALSLRRALIRESMASSAGSDTLTEPATLRKSRMVLMPPKCSLIT
jgi:hypothetical protein